ncbi:hypothetical protein DCS_02300 [Drechmeria coniospora]|uniref:Uncharacterized protein n=1 Tax=Drechmeria coniospora TaxID=98403 RepID=A0A151GVM6_DRECN|nr:hypothetical protein DCS_02300 [Drechmeria coniospora]KYK61159.1 hypothetical protein DCS_02300 [Drechmeria coniospora]
MTIPTLLPPRLVRGLWTQMLSAAIRVEEAEADAEAEATSYRGRHRAPRISSGFRPGPTGATPCPPSAALLARLCPSRLGPFSSPPLPPPLLYALPPEAAAGVGWPGQPAGMGSGAPRNGLEDGDGSPVEGRSPGLKREADSLSKDGEGDTSAAPGDEDVPDSKKRKKTTGRSSSSRGVANLTPEQLAKKRATGRLLPSPRPGPVMARDDVPPLRADDGRDAMLRPYASVPRPRPSADSTDADREAQRAVRERTRNQIETLERRIQELTSLDPYQELQAVVRSKEAVEKENAAIKRQLASVVGILNPIIGAGKSSIPIPPPPSPVS